MIIKELPVGPLQANCFIVGCEETREAAVIDPGDDVDQILMSLAESKLKVKYIINTHNHFDHVGGNARLKQVTKADLLIHKLDAPMLQHLGTMAKSFGMSVDDSPPADRELEEGDIVKVGNIEMKVVHTPGHSPGGICLITDKAVFAGDTLFAGSIGRTDLPGGDYDTLISGVREKLFVLDDDVTVYCGHGPRTTIGMEKKFNPFF